MAHGVIVVNSGILARADNEAQLAAVLGHELTHITHRHQIREFRAAKNRQTAINVAAFIGTLALAAAAVDQAHRGNYAAAQAISNTGPILQVGLQLTYTAMVSGYSRDMETEADQQGIRLMAQAGYPPREMAQFFRKLLADSPDANAIETFFWGNHPRTTERIEAAEAFARTYPTSATTRGNQEFEARMASVRVANAQWDAYLGRTALARSQIDRTVRAIPERPDKALLSRLLYAHVVASTSDGLASRGQTDTSTNAANQAISMYESVISEAPSVPGASNWLPVAYRSLGLFYYAQRDLRGRHCEAKAALEKYLELAPSATDRAMVTDRLRELSCTSQLAPTAQAESARPPKTLSACSSGEYRDSATGACQRIGGASGCPSGQYWSSATQGCTRVGQ
jgi:predicted Zn-dependent protease